MRAGLSWFRMLGDLVHFLSLGLHSRTSLAAENLFLRKQLAFYQERKVKPRRADNPTLWSAKTQRHLMQRGPRGRTPGEARSIRDAPQLGLIGRNDASDATRARGD